MADAGTRVKYTPMQHLVAGKLAVASSEASVSVVETTNDFLRSRHVMMFRFLLTIAFTSVVFAQSPAAKFKDDFSEAKLAVRRPARGEWRFQNHVASCTQDDALYAKSKDHGPILFYNQPFQDGTIRFSFKTDGCKTVVFTANGEKGHVFRFVATPTLTSVRAFAPGDEHKSEELAKGPGFKAGEWTDVVVDLRGTKASLKIGNFTKSVESPCYTAAKTNFSIGFSFGTLSVKGVAME